MNSLLLSLILLDLSERHFPIYPSLSCSSSFFSLVLSMWSLHQPPTRPGVRVTGFGGYRWYPPGLAPPAAIATRFHFFHFFCPHSLILLQFQIDLLAFSAVSPIRFSVLFLSPPSTPMSLSRDTIDEAGKQVIYG